MVTSFDQMARIIGTYDSIGHLVFLLHGSSGDLVIKGIHKDLSKFCALIKKKVMVNKKVSLDGCNVGDYNGAVEMAKMQSAFSAPEIVGYAGFHAWDFLPIPAKSSLDKTKALLAKYQKFIVPGQPGPEQLANKPAPQKLLLDWIAASRVFKPPTTPEELRTTKSIREVPKRRITSKEAEAVGKEMGENPLAVLELTIVP